MKGALAHLAAAPPSKDVLAGRIAAVLAATALTATVSCWPAYAQTMDYGALEQLFGEPVTASATGKPERASEVPANMEIITRDDIRRSGADNIPDILRFVTGLDVRTYGIADQEVAIRGYNQPPNPRLLVMVNGRQVYFDDYGYVSWSTIPVQLDEIRQIEVVKGPNSALFGFNAASGVINIITDDPLRDSTNAVTVRAGTQDLLEGSAVGTAHLGDTAGIRVSAGGFSARDFEPLGLTSSNTFARPAPQHGTFNLDGRWQIAPGIELMAEGGMAESRTAENLGGIFFDLHYRTNTARIGGAAESGIGLLSFDLYRNQTRFLYHSLLLGDEPLDNVVYVAKASDLVNLGADHTVRLGLEYRDNAATGIDFAGRVGYRVYAADVMWDWKIMPRLSLTNAVRIDHLTLNYAGVPVPGSGLSVSHYDATTFTEPSFNSGLVWQATELDALRLTAARGLQAPSLDDFGTQHQGTPASIGNPNLSPTFIWNAEFGDDHKLPSLGSVLRASVFVQRNESLLGSNWFATPTLLPSGLFASVAQNIGYSDEVGVEIGLKGSSPSGFRWNVSYAFASVSDHIDPVAANLAFSYSHATPQHTVILGGGYSVDRWEFDAEGRWQSSFQDYRFNTSTFGYDPVDVGNYVTLNARVGYKVTDLLTIAATVEQLNQSRILETAGPPVERRLILSATARF